MNSLFVWLSVALVSVASANNLYFKGHNLHNPKFCNGLDCPEYTVVHKFKDYELREYSVSYWVSTNIVGVSYKKATDDMFMRLFNYISGANEKKQKIDMTAPVITRIIPSQGPACESNFTMSFFISPKVKDPPKPTNKDVFLSELAQQRVYVRYFPGYHMSDIEFWIKEAIDLATSINDTSKYKTNYYYIAGYDSPFRFLNRHNEIWFIANGNERKESTKTDIKTKKVDGRFNTKTDIKMKKMKTDIRINKIDDKFSRY